MNHTAVVIALQLVETGLGMPGQFHHTRQILVLVVASVKFQLAVTAYQDKWWAILAHPVERSVLVYGRLQGVDSLHFTHVIVRNRLSAEGNIGRHGIGIHAVLGQPRLVQTEHHREVAACRVSCNEDFSCTAAKFPCMAEYPRNGFCRIVQCLVDGHFRQQAVVDTYNDVAPVPQFIRNFLCACFQPSSVEPDNDGQLLLSFRIVNIQFQTLERISILFGGVGNIFCPVVFLCQEASRQKAISEN